MLLIIFFSIFNSKKGVTKITDGNFLLLKKLGKFLCCNVSFNSRDLKVKIFTRFCFCYVQTFKF